MTPPDTVTDDAPAPGGVVRASLEELEAMEAGDLAAPSAPETSAPAATPAEPAAGQPQDPAPAEPEGQPAPAAPEEQWLRPGQFRTAEDALRSYDELRPAFDRANQRAAAAEARLAAMEQAMQMPPQGQAPQPAAPAQPQISREELERLMYEDPARYHEIVVSEAEARAAAAIEQRLAPVLGYVVENVHQSQTQNVLGQLQQLVGPEAYERHQVTLGQIMEADQEFFLDEQTRLARMQLAVQALEYQHMQRSGPPQAPQRDLPRDPSTGQFVSPGQAPAAPVYTEPGSTAGAPAPQAPADPRLTDPVKADFLTGERAGDIYGERPQRVLRS